MKAEDLMIGDWVTMLADNARFPKEAVGETIPCKVIGLSMYKTESVRVANNFDYMDVDPEELSPIPLTVGIVERNGFRTDRKNIAYRLREYKGDDTVYIAIHFSEVSGKTTTVSVEHIDENTVARRVDIGGNTSVHELQHALRICKIEKEIVLF